MKGCFPELFKLRDKEKSLSVNWSEYYINDEPKQQIKKSINDFRCSFLKGKKIPINSAFAKLNVKELKNISNSYSCKIRIVTESNKDNKSHAGIRQLTQDNNLFLDDLCELAFNSHIDAKNISNY